MEIYREEGRIKNHHGAVGKSSSEQFRKCDVITLALLNFWSRTPSATGSYVRLAGRRNPGDFQIHYYRLN